MSKIRVGVVGVGTMGQRHCRVYSTMRNIDFVGVADLNKRQGGRVATTYDIEYFENYEEFLTRVDAISIVTTTPSHFKLATEALDAGVHLLVEKPITETVEQGQALIEKADAAGVTLQIGHIERFNSAFIELKKIVSNMRLVSVNARRLSSFDASNTDVNVVLDLMIHDLDLVTDLLGTEYDEPQAMGRSISTQAIDHAVANFSFSNGPIASLVASRITEQKVRAIEIIAEGAYIEADLLSKSLVIHRQTLPQYVDNLDASTYRQESIIERIHVPMMEPLALELNHFIQCVETGETPAVSGRDGLRALTLAHTIIEQINRSSMAMNTNGYLAEKVMQAA